MTFDELTPWLFARVGGGVRWGLERTERLLAGVGDPHRRFSSVLIGGTNGKGSVAALCDAALRAGRNARIGLYTSPHLVSFEERVRINGLEVSGEVLADAATRLRPAIEKSGATFFEATTAMAFLVFAEAGADLVVAEVGLGGRLDATNVLTPLVTAVTNIGHDHAEYLGDRLESIALEKAGIFKSGVPAIVGAEQDDLVQILAARAAEVGAPFHRLDDRASVSGIATDRHGTTFRLHSSFWGEHPVFLPLSGTHQARNALLAAELIALLPIGVRPRWEEVARGFGTANWAGRMQIRRLRGTTWVFDVAHNEEGALTLARALAVLDLPRPIILVIGILADKAWRRMLPPLLDASDAAVLTVPTSAPAGRIWDPAEVARWAEAERGTAPRVIPHLQAALDRASTLTPHGTIVVTGSVHTVGDALRILEIPVG